ncbi:murein hydrolase activator EnvC family protein [Prolixibacter denitrificans]|uniref:Peptidase n=1 Tax=Prolixibacter denitrificans TaxID=1541063 RepID=A0A2P8CHC6_9BACT|nr:peptidoglycan DD-metalloendopeptidase family protein [Prolixibacter denitrificans]PSK84387.1 septal ring factor EnvC (AmiA/AmiB activator) [Prolixibacter denitrificans]GET20561.1 peptidase [Prolixibacter denitrificans]
MSRCAGIFIAVFFVMAGALTASAQSLTDLRKKKQKTSEEIKYTNQLLEETSKNAKTSLNRLALLNKQIRLREQLINEINGEIAYLDSSIADNAYVVNGLTSDLKRIRANYAQMIRYARRNADANSKLLFLLSAEDFNQAYKRFLYLRQYADYRKKQVESILAVKDILDAKLADLEKRRKEKENMLEQKQDESTQIRQQKVQQNQYYAGLQKKQRELKKKLEQQREVEQRLQKEIERIIAEEAKKSAAKNKKGFSLTPAEKELSDDFGKNKGRFPWPVDRGLITEEFGEHPHPVLKRVMVRNNGIDITTSAGEKARAIFRGTVSRVVAIPGGNIAVIIRHGNYLSVYSNLSDVFVRVGQKVETKQEIGKIYTDPGDNKTVLKFQIWHENKKQNPEDWIVKK